MGSIGRNEGGGQSSKHERLDFASSSTCALELAKGQARFCQFEHTSARIGRTEDSGWLAKSREAQKGGSGRPRAGRLVGSQTRMERWRVVRQEWRDSVGGWTRVERLGFANLSTCVLKLAELN